jgi:hypothetical protein
LAQPGCTVFAQEGFECGGIIAGERFRMGWHGFCGIRRDDWEEERRRTRTHTALPYIRKRIRGIGNENTGKGDIGTNRFQ